MQARTKRASAVGNGTDTLSRLLASEENLARQLESAREEADRIVRDAEEHAKRTEDSCAATIEERAASLLESGERQLRDDIDRLSVAADDEIRRFETAGAKRTPELVRLVLGELGVFGAGMTAGQTR